jgi:hypothetical protein
VRDKKTFEQVYSCDIVLRLFECPKIDVSLFGFNSAIPRGAKIRIIERSFPGEGANGGGMTANNKKLKG